MFKKLAIYSVEARTPGSSDMGTHAYLALVNEETGGVFDQIHMNYSTQVETKGLMVRDLLIHNRYRYNEFLSSNFTTFHKYIAGSPEHVLALWDKATEAAQEIEDARLWFMLQSISDKAINCRSALIAILKRIGFEFVSTNPEAISGTNLDIWSLPHFQSKDNGNNLEQGGINHLEI